MKTRVKVHLHVTLNSEYIVDIAAGYYFLLTRRLYTMYLL